MVVFAIPHHTPSTDQRRRIAVIGATGVGKSTLARAISRCLRVPHLELDALYHLENWTPAPEAVLRDSVARAVAHDGWVADGNYGQVRDLVWGRAELIVWLDYSLPRTLSRLFLRTLRRGLRREVLWNGNRERLSNFYRRDSILLWALQTHARHRRENPARFRQPEHAHLTVVRLSNPRVAARWLAAFCGSAEAAHARVAASVASRGPDRTDTTRSRG